MLNGDGSSSDEFVAASAGGDGKGPLTAASSTKYPWEKFTDKVSGAATEYAEASGAKVGLSGEVPAELQSDVLTEDGYPVNPFK